jgi:SAM-dependent methyltransferase
LIIEPSEFPFHQPYAIVRFPGAAVTLAALGAEIIMADESNSYQRFLERYESERVPWDDYAPPPEITALTKGLPPGRALDLGCGYGRAAIYLAQSGWSVDGVDFIPQAIREARRRAMVAGVSESARFYLGSAAQLDFLAPAYDLAIDVGCMHSFDEATLLNYRDTLARLVRPGGLYVLFVHLRDDEAAAGEGPRGIPEADVITLLGETFRLERVERGTTQVEDRPPWRSGWFWFRRL